ncbi:MAG: DsbA family protein [Candidatus Staskawiczbacteria bacterium]|nr:DsbA family protein [Candidatus Staskawiczbacteria bacterium]
MPNSTEGINKNLLLVCASVIVVCLIVSGTVLYINAQKGGVQVNNNVPQAGPTVKVSMDDDAVLGEKNAPITMIEFSDYECPFCKRHFDQVYPGIKRDYIDTGKLKLVFRDFIAVAGHNPLATSQALAAECAGDQGGDAMYYKYHDEIFKKTTSNGNGMPVSYLATIATNLGLNTATFQQCLDSAKFKAEVDKDNTDANTAGVSGTPSFFVGKSTSSGTIDGTIIIGAQPYSVFKTALDKALSGK